MKKQFIIHILIGFINTFFIGVPLMYFLINLGVDPYLSNIMIFSIGLLSSYMLNKKLIYKVKPINKKEFFYFTISFFTAFFMNLVTLYILLSIEVEIYIAQIFAISAFTISSFLLNKFIAFKESDEFKN